jgi:hypothetical protein
VEIAKNSVALLIKTIRDKAFSQHLTVSGKLLKGNSVKVMS